MDRIDFSQTGFHGFSLQDLNFLQNAYKFGIGGIGAPFDDVVLTGCNVTVTTPGGGGFDVTVTDGLLLIAGEVVKVDAHTSNVANLLTDAKWKIVETPMSPSPVPYKTGSTLRNVHFSRKAIIDSGGTVLFWSLKTYSGKLKDLISSAGINYMTLNTDWAAGENPVPNPGYYKMGNTCHLVGDIKASTASPSNLNCLLLPTEARPLCNILRPAIACNYNTFYNSFVNVEVTYISIKTNGSVYVPSLGGTKSIMLDCSYPCVN